MVMILYSVYKLVLERTPKHSWKGAWLHHISFNRRGLEMFTNNSELGTFVVDALWRARASGEMRRLRELIDSPGPEEFLRLAALAQSEEDFDSDPRSVLM